MDITFYLLLRIIFYYCSLYLYSFVKWNDTFCLFLLFLFSRVIIRSSIYIHLHSPPLYTRILTRTHRYALTVHMTLTSDTAYTKETKRKKEKKKGHILMHKHRETKKQQKCAYFTLSVAERDTLIHSLYHCSYIFIYWTVWTLSTIY